MKRADQQARTRAALLDAAAELVVERGLAGASAEAICARAGYTRGAFYSNFESKEQLFVELLHERVYGYFPGMAEEDPDRRRLLPLILELLAEAGRSDRVRELAATFWSHTRALAAESIRRAATTAGRPEPEDVEALAAALVALDIGLALQHHVDPEAVPPNLLPDVYDRLFAPAVTSEQAPDRAARPRMRGSRRA